MMLSQSSVQEVIIPEKEKKKVLMINIQSQCHIGRGSFVLI